MTTRNDGRLRGTRVEDRARAAETLHYRTKGGMAVVVYLFGDGNGAIWYNDGPPPTHEPITEEQLEIAVADGQLRDSWCAEGVESF